MKIITFDPVEGNPQPGGGKRKTNGAHTRVMLHALHNMPACTVPAMYDGVNYCGVVRTTDRNAMRNSRAARLNGRARSLRHMVGEGEERNIYRAFIAENYCAPADARRCGNDGGAR